MPPNAPGKSHREGIAILQLAVMFPDETAALQQWFEDCFWPHGRCCGRCGSTRTREAAHA